jgi:hypothetical protein
MPAASTVVFEVLHDYPRRLEWDTLLSDARVLGDDPPAVGVETVCTSRKQLGAIAFHTRYVTFQPPGGGRPGLAAVALVRPTSVFATWAASIRHQDLTPGLSNLTYTLTFTCRPALLAPTLEPVAQQLFIRETRRRLAALADYLAAGGGAAPTGGGRGGDRLDE